jgi:hypothetical protein
VPDPQAGPGGEPTAFVPPAGSPEAPPTAMVPPVAPVPPPVPPPGYPVGPPAQPGYPSQPPPQPPAGPPGYPQAPAYGQPAPYGTPPGGYAAAPVAGAAVAPEKKKRSKLWLVLGLLVLLAVLAIGAIGAVALLGSSSSGDLTATVGTCQIAADGSLTTSGLVRNSGGDSQKVKLTVVFDNADGGKQVDRSFVDITVPANGKQSWQATGNAADDVKKVTCVVSDLATG